MIIAKNDEEKRSKIWRIVTTTATVVIIAVAAYFLFTLFAGNPLEGTWVIEGSNLYLTIQEEGSATIGWSEMSIASDVEIQADYTLDKVEKTITFKIEESELAKVAEVLDEEISASALQAEVRELETTFDYNLERNRVTFAEREYGEQIVFVKK